MDLCPKALAQILVHRIIVLGLDVINSHMKMGQN